MKIFFAYTDHITKESVLPLYEKCKSENIECDLLTRGGYTELDARLNGYTHYVFGVGADRSWDIARKKGLKTINIQHGQYVFNTFFGFHADVILCMGQAYVDDGNKYLKDPKILIDTGYIRARSLLKYNPNEEKTIDCLIILPHTGEHKHLNVVNNVIELVKDLNINYQIKPHPRNSAVIQQLKNNNINNIISGDFYELISKSKCCISAPSNCILECATWNVPCAFIGKALSPATKVSDFYYKKCQNSYSKICYFGDDSQLKEWVKNPYCIKEGDPKYYISNPDGNIDLIVKTFMEYL